MTATTKQDRDWSQLSMLETASVESVMEMVENAIAYVSTVPMGDDARDEALWLMDTAHGWLCARLDDTY